MSVSTELLSMCNCIGFKTEIIRYLSDINCYKYKKFMLDMTSIENYNIMLYLVLHIREEFSPKNIYIQVANRTILDSNGDDVFRGTYVYTDIHEFVRDCQISRYNKDRMKLNNEKCRYENHNVFDYISQIYWSC